MRGEPPSQLSVTIGWRERNVVDCFRLRDISAIADEAELPRYDFRPIAFARFILGFVLAGSKPPLRHRIIDLWTRTARRYPPTIRTLLSDANLCGFALRRFDL
jgi:hypothetical protein